MSFVLALSKKSVCLGFLHIGLAIVCPRSLFMTHKYEQQSRIKHKEKYSENRKENIVQILSKKPLSQRVRTCKELR